MKLEDVRNNHIKILATAINESAGDTIPSELADLLIKELPYSTFIKEDINILLDIAGEERELIELYTDLDEFNKYSKEQKNPSDWDFPNVIRHLENLYGILINPGHDNFFITPDIIIEALEQFTPFNRCDLMKDSFSNEELRKIMDADYDYLDKSLDKDFEDACDELSKSLLFTFLISDDDISDGNEDGIIELGDDKNATVFIIVEEGMEFALLFTSPKYFNPTASFYKNEGRHVYSHIINLELLAKVVLDLDLDGIIVNYAHPNMKVFPREYLLDYMGEIIKASSHFEDFYANYAFLLD